MLTIDKETSQVIEALWIGLVRNGVTLRDRLPHFRGTSTKEIASRSGLPFARVRDLLAELSNDELPSPRYYFDVVFGEGSQVDSWTIWQEEFVEELLGMLGIPLTYNYTDGVSFSWTVPAELTDEQIRGALARLHESFENLEKEFESQEAPT